MYVLCGGSYEEGSTGSMAEEGRECDSEGLQQQLESLLSRYTSKEQKADGEPFCSDFRKLVEEHASRWQVPLPQLRILEIALRCFARASTSFELNCDHVLHTLSSLALSVFELLLFFDQKDLHQEPLKRFTVTFQECHLALTRHQNVHLLQVERLVRGGGPWACPALQAILSESSLPQSEVDGCISSELPVFLELRVRYLLSCERVGEAMALAKCCAWHPTAGQHLFFLQVYLTWLLKTSQHDRLHREVADFNGKDAIHIICSLEAEEKDELLLALSRAFLTQQLRRGDMYCLCDLVFVWSKLHSRLKTSKQALLEESHQMMLSATNVHSIFPFIRAILQELGEDGIQFCVELCANALESCRPCDVITKSLIYKTIAGLLPDDLEVCRACALLVFFLERTVEAYKIVYLLYMHPDQEYHVEQSPIRNHVRFETLQVLKKDLYFDPEFWNLIALRTNCLKLMSEKVVSAALEEIMEDKWILNYCTKEPARQKGSRGALQGAAKKRHQKEDTDNASKRLKVGPGRTRLNVDHTVKKKGSRPLKDGSSQPLRRSFWQLDRQQDNGAAGYGELRRTTRLSEKNPPKRRIRKPRWLLEDSGTLGGNNVPPKIKKNGLKHQKHHRSPVEKRSEKCQIKNSAKHKPSGDLMARENSSSKQQKGLSLDCVKPATPPQVILELSLPDNELMGTFIEETCNRQRGFPQVLLYRPTVKVPATSQPVKPVHGKEVILRARDATMFVQQLHCYARRQKGKGNASNIQGSVSTITRSSVQGSPPKDPLCGKPAAEGKGPAAAASVSEKDLPVQTTRAASRKLSLARELPKKSAVEMKATSQKLAAAKATQFPVLNKVPQTQSTGKVSQTRTREVPAAEIKVATASADVTEAPSLDKVLQAQTKELCEESAVEMKVTIASNTPSVTSKVTQSPGLDKYCKSQTVKDASKTTTSAEITQTLQVVSEEIPPVSIVDTLSIAAADPMSSQSQGVEKQPELKSLSSQAEPPGVLTTVCNSISDLDVSAKLSEGHAPCENRTMVTADQDSINDMSALTLVTEMVTELAPETRAHKRPPPEDSHSKDLRAGSKLKAPHKFHTTSSCSVPGLEASADADVQGNKEGTQDFAPEMPENSEAVESEESRLEHSCTFCNKVFKGSRVVAHAMFHYRKDECMFCGTMFKDDLLAMMHLSDHIEKLKKSKESAGNSAQENWASETKDISTPKTSAKAKTANMSSGRRRRGRPRKSAVCPKSVSLPDSTSSGSRKLRSNDKPVEGLSLKEKTQNVSKHLSSKTPIHKMNGHISKKKELDRPRKDALNSQDRTSDGAKSPRSQENQDIEVDSSTSLQAELQDKVFCPAEGCTWSTGLTKNRVGLLYHALEDHYGEVKPLELSFRIGNNRCSICMRVLWSFEHFQHHVERHRLAPRHPCLHKGCTSRFKTGIEMRRHARRHSPLQAVCCLPGCSQLFICLWALNLHERDHYASKPTKPDKNTNEQTGDKHKNATAGRKLPDLKPKDEAATTAVNKTESVKATRKSRGQATHSSSTEKHVETAPPTAVSASLMKLELKESSETTDPHVLKNLSNKDSSAQPSGPSLRLRQTIRKVKAANTSTAALKRHKVSSSKHKIKVRHKFKKKQLKVNSKVPKRRGRPPKTKMAVHDENTTAGQSDQSVQEQTVKRGAAQLPKTSNESKELKDDDQSPQVQNVKTTETSSDQSKSKKSVNKQLKKNHVKQKEVSDSPPPPIMKTHSLNKSINATSADGTQMKQLHKAKKRSAPKDTASSDSSKSKKHKLTNVKDQTQTKRTCPESAPRKPEESDAVVPQVEAKAVAAATVENSADEEGKAKAENSDSTQNTSGNAVQEVTAPPSASGENTQKLAREEESKKSEIRQKEGRKEKNTHRPSSDSVKTNKKCKDANKKGDKERRLSKDGDKTSALKKTPKSKSERVETAAVKSSAVDVEEKEETSNATPDSSGSSIPAATGSSVHDTTSPPAATEENLQKVTEDKPKKSHVVKNPDPNKAKKKRKVVQEEGAAKKMAKKKCKDQSVPSASETSAKPKAPPLSEVHTEVEGSAAGEEARTVTPPSQTPQSTVNGPGYSMILNGKDAEESTSTVCKDTLAKYGKKPYLRPPPTAYLDEKYITMPKRRKEMSFLERTPPPEQASDKAAPQRQRCANCFTTFSSAEGLQQHQQLQRCSNLFGFDSDDEGNS